MIAVVDYGGGNTASALKALRRVGAECVMSSCGGELLAADRIVLPGVGAFGDVMAGLASRGLIEPLREFLRCGRPFLGICVGLQVLLESSEESPGVSGLGALPGAVVRFRHGKVPQIGWNEVQVSASAWLLPGHYYFVNSYYGVPADESAVSAFADYHGAFCCAVEVGAVSAVQFHPEKSGALGLESLARWLQNPPPHSQQGTLVRENTGQPRPPPRPIRKETRSELPSRTPAHGEAASDDGDTAQRAQRRIGGLRAC